MTAHPARPDGLEALLLQAGLREPERARGSWDKFCARIADIEALNDGCYELFPLVAANLQEFASSLPHREYLQSVLKHSWARSWNFLNAVTPILQKFQDEGIDFLVFKGVALTPLYYQHWGARSGMNLGLLIHPQVIESAFELMHRAGWNSLSNVQRVRKKDFIRFGHETNWVNPDKIVMQLRWHLVQGCCDGQTERDQWGSSVPCTLPGLQTKTLGTTDHFLQICVDGADFNQVPANALLTDAAMIIRNGDFDWATLEKQARYCQRINPVREVVLHLDRLDLGVHASQAKHWRNMKTGALETLENTWRRRKPVPRGVIKKAALAYLRYYRDAPLSVLWQNLRAYMRQLDDVKGILRRIVLIGYVLRWNRLRRTDG